MADIKMTIKEARSLAQLTQNDIYEKIGIPKRTLQDWEAGKRNPPAWLEKLVIEKILNLKKIKA